MNILLTANCFPPDVGGTESYSYDLAKNLSRQPGTRVVIFAPHTREAQSWDAECALDIVRFRTPMSRTFLFFRLLFSRKIDKIYITHRAHFLTLACLARRWLKLPFWVTLHGTEYFGPDKSRAIVQKLHKAEKVIATSHFVLKEACKRGLSPSRVCIIPPSLDTERFHPGIDASLLRSRLGRKKLEGKIIFLTLCRLVEQKCVDHVIEALARVRGQLPDFHYFIVGEGEEGGRLRDLVQNKSLQDHVTLVGAVPHHLLTREDGAFLNLCDIFILASRDENFGICYLEAGACGKPVIACQSGGVEDAVLNNETGLLVPPGDIEAIGKAMVLLAKNREFAGSLGARARARIEAELSANAVGQRIWNLMHFNEV